MSMTTQSSDQRSTLTLNTFTKTVMYIWYTLLNTSYLLGDKKTAHSPYHLRDQHIGTYQGCQYMENTRLTTVKNFSVDNRLVHKYSKLFWMHYIWKLQKQIGNLVRFYSLLNSYEFSEFYWALLFIYQQPYKGKKEKFSHIRYQASGPELIPVYRQSAHRWLEAIHLVVGCHYFLPGLRLPSQPKSVTAHRPVPNYTAWWQRHMRVSSLPKAVTWKRTGRDSIPRPLGSHRMLYG